MINLLYLVVLCYLLTTISSNTSFNISEITFTIRDEVNMIPDINGEFINFTFAEIVEIIIPDPFDNRSENDIDREQKIEFNVLFFLFTRKNPEHGQKLEIDSLESVTQSNFNATNPTRIIIHGWQNHKASPVNVLIRNAYLTKSDYNIIVVDWSEGASSFSYPKSRNYIKYVGSKVAEMIEFLVDNAGLDIETLHLVGHSLGAHVCGMTGKAVKYHLHTIIALDPAGPLFYVEQPEDRLTQEDAGYVEVIHTNAGFYGIQDPIGEADYYINGGKKQPGCGLDFLKMCSHNRAFELFAESINSQDGFWSTPCHLEELNGSKCSRRGVRGIMGDFGEEKLFRIHGIYKLLTRNSSPYALGRSME